jgi:hypothetical protein
MQIETSAYKAIEDLHYSSHRPGGWSSPSRLSMTEAVVHRLLLRGLDLRIVIDVHKRLNRKLSLLPVILDFKDMQHRFMPRCWAKYVLKIYMSETYMDL